MALDYNGQLRRAFVQLHDILVESVNSSQLVEHLFASGVLSSDEHLELFEVSDRSDKTRRLLAMLYGSQHPKAFIQLRRSMKRHESSRWLVDEIDRRTFHYVSKFISAESGVLSSQKKRLPFRLFPYDRSKFCY
jgi:Caspase recruitment domain